MVRMLQFIAILFTAIALVGGGAHLLELRGKMSLPHDTYLTVQRLYRG